MISEQQAQRIEHLPQTVDLAKSLDEIAQSNRREGYQPARTLAFDLRKSARETLRHDR